MSERLYHQHTTASIANRFDFDPDAYWLAHPDEKRQRKFPTPRRSPTEKRTPRPRTPSFSPRNVVQDDGRPKSASPRKKSAASFNRSLSASPANRQFTSQKNNRSHNASPALIDEKLDKAAIEEDPLTQELDVQANSLDDDLDNLLVSVLDEDRPDEEEAEAKRLAEEAELARISAQKEADAKQLAEEEEAARIAAQKEAETKRLAAAEKEAEEKRLAEEEAARLAAEEEAKEKQLAEEEAIRLAAEKEAEEKRLAEEEAIRLEKEAEEKRLEEEEAAEDAARIASEMALQEEAARLKAEEERLAEEEAARLKAEEKRLAEEEAVRLKAQNDKEKKERAEKAALVAGASAGAAVLKNKVEAQQIHNDESDTKKNVAIVTPESIPNAGDEPGNDSETQGSSLRSSKRGSKRGGLMQSLRKTQRDAATGAASMKKKKVARPVLISCKYNPSRGFSDFHVKKHKKVWHGLTDFEKGKKDAATFAKIIIEELFERDFWPGKHWEIDNARVWEADNSNPENPSFNAEKLATWDWKDIYSEASATAVIRFLPDRILIENYAYYVAG